MSTAGMPRTRKSADQKITYRGREYGCREGESVLEALERQGIETPFSCRQGICRICLLRRTDGSPPGDSQEGLRGSLRERGYFMACHFRPEEDTVIEPARDADLFSPATIRGKEELTPDIYRLWLEPATPLYYRAGQFLNLRRSDGTTRSYSLASVPALDELLELHVRRVPGGELSTWIHDELEVGGELDFQGPQGQCYYVGDQPDQKILLIATGTGLAPLLGVLRDALHSGHRGDIHLYHGVRSHQDLYQIELLRDLECEHGNFRFVACVSGGEAFAGCRTGQPQEEALRDHGDLTGWEVYLCGHPAVVRSGRSLAIQAGAAPTSVRADPFEGPHVGAVWGSDRPSSEGHGADGADGAHDADVAEPPRTPYPDPDPEIWSALEEGPLLTTILTDFYDKAYADPRLGPFFDGVTVERAIQKQYSFLCQVFTGEKIYFGDSPRTFHHWMVISDELFDYREEMLADSMRKFDLDEAIIRRWRATHERYRQDIVKSAPRPKVLFGKELPLSGFGRLTLEVGILCDLCGEAIDEGTEVRYHLRLGTVYCDACSSSPSQAEPSELTVGAPSH